MSIGINLWAVLLAGVSSMVIGSLYYAKSMFGVAWRKQAHIDDKKFEKEMPKKMVGVFIAALITAEVVAYFMYLYHAFFDDSWIGAGIDVSLILWLGVSATTLHIHNSMDQRSNHLTYISMGNRLLSLLAMGLILGWLHP